MIEKTKIKALIKVVFNFDVNDEIGLLRAYFTCEAIKSQPDFGDDIEQAYKRAKKECTVIEKKAFAYIVPPRRCWSELEGFDASERASGSVFNIDYKENKIQL